MKQQLFCNRTRSFNSFFLQITINIIFPLSAVYGIMEGALYVRIHAYMHECMYISVYMYVDMHAYVCASGQWLYQCQTEKN